VSWQSATPVGPPLPYYDKCRSPGLGDLGNSGACTARRALTQLTVDGVRKAKLPKIRRRQDLSLAPCRTKSRWSVTTIVARRYSGRYVSVNARSDLACHHFLFSTVADVANWSSRLNGTHSKCISAATSSVRLDGRITDGSSSGLVALNTG
jgi:hypothetical protein